MMMAAAKYDIDVEQGATKRFTITWMQSNGVTPVNLTGCTAHMQVRSKVNDPTVLLNLTEADGIVLGGAAGTIQVTLTDVQTASLSLATAVYDLYVLFPDGDHIRVIEGSVKVDFTVTVNA